MKTTVKVFYNIIKMSTKTSCTDLIKMTLTAIIKVATDNLPQQQKFAISLDAKVCKKLSHEKTALHSTIYIYTHTHMYLTISSFLVKSKTSMIKIWKYCENRREKGKKLQTS